MARQLVDAWHALSVLAPEHGLDWLVHLDADELFDPGTETTAGDLFWCMSVAGARCSTFQNWEAVPEVDGASNPFVTHTLFKKPLALVPDDACTTFWERRHGSAYETYFLFYDNGKASCCVEPRCACVTNGIFELTNLICCKLGAKPLSVHEWLPGDANGLECWASNLPGLLRVDGHQGPAAAMCVGKAKVLHYPVCSSANLLKKFLQCSAMDHRPLVMER